MEGHFSKNLSKCKSESIISNNNNHKFEARCSSSSSNGERKSVHFHIHSSPENTMERDKIIKRNSLESVVLTSPHKFQLNKRITSTPQWISNIFTLVKCGNLMKLKEVLGDFDETLIRHLTDSYGNSALHVASFYEKLEIVEWLLQILKKSNSIRNILLHERNGSNLSILQLVLKSKSNNSFKFLVEKYEEVLERGKEDELTLLHYAAIYGNKEMILWLLTHQFTQNHPFLNVNSKSTSGLTPLHLATQNNHLSSVVLLIKKGANPLLKTQLDMTALDIAINEKRVILIEYLTMCEVAYKSLADIDTLSNRYSHLEKSLHKIVDLSTNLLLGTQLTHPLNKELENVLKTVAEEQSSILSKRSLESRIIEIEERSRSKLSEGGNKNKSREEESSLKAPWILLENEKKSHLSLLLLPPPTSSSSPTSTTPQAAPSPPAVLEVIEPTKKMELKPDLIVGTILEKAKLRSKSESRLMTLEMLSKSESNSHSSLSPHKEALQTNTTKSFGKAWYEFEGSEDEEEDEKVPNIGNTHFEEEYL